MCVFSAVIKPTLGNIIRRGGVMRPKRYPYSRNQWKVETTVLYGGDNRKYYLSRKVNRITGETKDA